jgi:hypothetical protein
MARIRTIKPEFFTSSDILSLTPLARLFYVSLWCESDREGLLSWNTDTLKFRYFPKDKVDIEVLAAELVSQKLINIMTGDDGREYAEIPSFKSHQVINNRESESILLSRVKGASPRVLGEGRKEGKGKEGNTQGAATSSRFDPRKELEKLGVPTQLAEDFLSVRKTKRAPLTSSALDGIVVEAGKAGIPLDGALRIACRRGWQGFEASWLKEGDLLAAKPAMKDWE